MQNQGTIGPATVAELLQGMQHDRATGTLSLESDGRECALHFLFGHLFHAVSDQAQGEDAVMAALEWSSGEYAFNPRAKLPPEETINSSTEELVSRWQSGVGAAAPEAVGATMSAVEPLGYEPFITASARGSDSDWPSAGLGGDVAEDDMPDIAPFQSPVPPARTPPPVPSAPSAAPVVSQGARPAPVGTPVVTAPPKPAPRPGAAPPRPVAGATRSQLSVLVPMPGGPSLHSGLKASFLNFPMLLKTLGQDGFSGFVSVHGEGDDRGQGHILFREGSVIQAQQRAEGTYRRGKTALQEVTRLVALGRGLIDAVELPSDLASSVASLIVATTSFVNLPARIVDFEALLEYIGDQRISGGVLISQADQVSVALLTDGSVKGSYSNAAPELTDGPQVAAAACADREARIDVVAAPAPPLPALDLSELG
ncbi:MAG: DUF4388 domain-containing protein [Candidatus Dormibacteria bacterium]